MIISELVATIEIQDNATASLNTVNKAIGNTAEIAGTSFQEAASHAQNFGTGLDDQTPKTVSFADKVGKMANSFASVGHAVDSVDNMFDRYELTEMSVENATLRLERAQEAYTEALAKSGEGSEEAEAAARNLEIATNRNEAAQIRAKSSMVMIGLQAVSLVGQYAGAAGGALKFAASGTVLASASGVLTGALTTASTALTGLSTLLLANPIVLVLAAIVAAVVALKYAWDTNFGDIQGKTASAIEFIKGKLGEIPGALDAVSTAFDTVKANAGSLESALGPLGIIITYLKGGTDDYAISLDENKNAMDAANLSGQSYASTTTSIRTSVSESIGSITSQTSALSDQLKYWEFVTTSMGMNTQEVRDNILANADATERLALLKDEENQLKLKLDEVTQAKQLGRASTEDLIAAEDALKAKTDEVKTAEMERSLVTVDATTKLGQLKQEEQNLQIQLDITKLKFQNGKATIEDVIIAENNLKNKTSEVEVETVKFTNSLNNSSTALSTLSSRTVIQTTSADGLTTSTKILTSGVDTAADRQAIFANALNKTTSALDQQRKAAEDAWTALRKLSDANAPGDAPSEYVEITEAGPVWMYGFKYDANGNRTDFTKRVTSIGNYQAGFLRTKVKSINEMYPQIVMMAKGGSFTTNGPTPIMAGEGNEREFVSVTPLSKLNSSGMTIINYFQAPIYGVADLERAIDSAFKKVKRNVSSMGG